ncbi:MAG: hypothetical protein JSR46_11125 [Verrucomicrobia bacterium]|nr:hypothetical protein [Verrucomicrobiota bacterium]
MGDSISGSQPYIPPTQPLQPGATGITGAVTQGLTNVPLYLLARASQLGSVVALPKAIKAASGATYLTTAGLELFFKTIHGAFEMAKTEKFLNAAKGSTEEAIRLSLESAQERRSENGQITQVGLSAMSMAASLLPGGGTIVTGVLEAAKTAERIEHEAEKANIHIAKKLLTAPVWAIKAILPTFFSVLGGAAKTGEDLSAWMKTKAVENWSQPEHLSESLANWADSIDASSFWLNHAYDEGVDKKLTVEVFHALDELDKLKICTLVQGEQEVQLETRGDWNSLSLDEQQEMAEDLVEKFNKLPQETREKLYTLSLQQYEELSPPAKKELFEIVKARIEEKGLSIKDLNENDFRTQLALLDTQFTTKEKLFILTVLQSMESAEVVATSTSEPVDMEKVREKIGPHVFSGQFGKDMFHCLGYLPKGLLYGAGGVGWALATTMSKLCSPVKGVVLPQELVNKSATALELALAFKFVQAGIVDRLQQLGAPMEQAEYYVRLLPASLLNATVTSLDYLISFAGGGLKTTDGWLAALVNLQKHMETVEKGGAASEVERFTEYTKSAELDLKATVNEMCRDPNQSSLFACKPEVKEYLTFDTWTEKLQSLGFKGTELQEQVTEHWTDVASHLAERGVLSNPKEIEKLFLRSPEALKNLFKAMPQLINDMLASVKHLPAKERLDAFVDLLTNIPVKFANDGTLLNPEILRIIIESKPTRWAQLAAETNTALYSPEFFKALEELVTTGTMPSVQEASQTGEIIASTVNAVGETTSGVLNSMWGWLPGGVSRGLSSLYQGVAAPVIETVSSTIKGTVRAGAQTVGQGLSAAAHAAKRAVGLEQAMPQEMKEKFDTLVTLHTQLSKAKATQQAYQFSSAAIADLESTWSGSIATTVASNERVKGAIDLYETTIRPKLQTAIATGEAIVHVARANEEFVRAQLEQPSLAAALQDHVKKNAESALHAIDADSSLRNSVADAISFGGAVTELVTTWGSGFVTMSIMKHVLPSALRSLAPKMEKGYWLDCAQEFVETTATTGEQTKEAMASAGGWLDHAFRTRLGYIDPLRIQNFYTLEPHERQHVIELAIDSPNASVSEKTTLKRLKDYRFDLLDTTGRKTLATTALQILDRDTPPEQITSTLTATRLEESGTAKIKHYLTLVRQYRPDLIEATRQENNGLYDLNALDHYLDPSTTLSNLQSKHKEKLLEVLASQFNQLRPHQKKECLKCTLSEFNALEPEEQKQLIGFLIKMSPESEYERLTNELTALDEGKKPDSSFIVKSFNALHAMDQAAFREAHEFGIAEKKRFTEGIQREIKKAEAKLQFFSSKIETFKEKHFLGLQLQRDNKKQEIEKLSARIADQEPDAAGVKSLEMAKKSLEDELQVLENTLQATAGKIISFQDEHRKLEKEIKVLKGLIKESASATEVEQEPLPPSMSEILNSAVKSTIHTYIDALEGSFLKQLETFSGPSTEFDVKLRDYKQVLTNTLSELEKKFGSTDELILKLEEENKSEETSMEQRVRNEMEIELLQSFYKPMHRSLCDAQRDFMQRFTNAAAKIYLNKYKTH